MTDLKIEKEVIESSAPESQKGLSGKIEKTKTKSKSYVMDLRIHSPASLGYLGIQGLDTAPALVRLAKVKGLDVIGLTDYFSGSYIDRLQEAAKDTLVTVIPGVDIRCCVGGCDDVTLTVLFGEGTTTAQVEEFLDNIQVPADARGNKDYVLRTPFEKIIEYVDYNKAVAFPSRIDKTPHRMAAIPTLVEQYGFRTFDIAYGDTQQFFKRKWPKIKFHLFSFSDANALAQVGSRTAKVKLGNPGFDGVRSLVARAG